MKGLLSIGPDTVAEDERVIARGYQIWLSLILAGVPIIVALLADTRWVVAAGFALVIALTGEMGGRLHDLCIRARRTNLLLREIRGEVSEP